MRVTKAEATKILLDIKRTYSDYIVPGAGPGDTPTLFDHTHEETMPGSWAIIWEGFAPEGWVYDYSEKCFTENKFQNFLLEPINNCALGVYAL